MHLISANWILSGPRAHYVDSLTVAVIDQGLSRQGGTDLSLLSFWWSSHMLHSGPGFWIGFGFQLWGRLRHQYNLSPVTADVLTHTHTHVHNNPDLSVNVLVAAVCLPEKSSRSALMVRDRNKRWPPHIHQLNSGCKAAAHCPFRFSKLWNQSWTGARCLSQWMCSVVIWCLPARFFCLSVFGSQSCWMGPKHKNTFKNSARNPRTNSFTAIRWQEHKGLSRIRVSERNTTGQTGWVTDSTEHRATAVALREMKWWFHLSKTLVCVQVVKTSYEMMLQK